MSIQFDIAKQIIAETCPNRKLKLENIRLFADIIQPKKYQKGDIILNEGDICNPRANTSYDGCCRKQCFMGNSA